MMFPVPNFSVLRSIHRSFIAILTTLTHRSFLKARSSRLMLQGIVIASTLMLSACQVEDFITQDVTLRWTPPEERADGSQMSAQDIRGYLIRYRPENEKRYQTTVVTGSDTTEHRISGIVKPEDHRFQIATIDTFGRYSDFVEAK